METTPDTLTRFYRPRELAALLGLTRQTIWKMRQRGEFPRPVRLGRRRVGWSETTIRAWLASRQA